MRKLGSILENSAVLKHSNNMQAGKVISVLSEYSRRIIAFSAVAIVLGIGISVGIVLLPQAAKTTSETTMVQTETFASTTASVASSTATATQSVSSIVTQGGTTITSMITSVATTVSSLTTVETSVSTVTAVSTTVVSTSTTVNSSSVISTATTTTGVSCIVAGYPDGIYLQVLTNSGSPISGLAVSGQAIYSVCGQTYSNSVATSTNSTGWAYLGSNPGYYYISFTYNGANYDLTIPSQPITMSIATYYVPSGNLTVSYCVSGNMKECSS